MIPARPEGTLVDRAACAPLVDVTALAPGNVLVLAPHADDETLGCGEAIAAARTAGRGVGVVLVTDGTASHPGSRRYPAAALEALRSAEFTAATGALAPGIATLQLAERDAGLTGARDELRRLADAVGPFATALAPAVVWTTWEHDPHCDHRAVAQLGVLLAGRLGVPCLAYAVWGRFGRTPAEGMPMRFANETANRAKRRAAACYPSQLTPLIDDDPNGFMMPPALTGHFLSAPEVFLL